LWDVGTGKEIPKAQAHDSSVEDAAFSPDGKTVATVGADTKIRLWNPKTGRALGKMDLPGRQNWGGRLAYVPDGSQLAVSGRDGCVHFWDPGTGRYLHFWSGIPPEINGASILEAFAISPDGKALAVSCFQTVRLLDLATGKEVQRLKESADRVAWMSFSADGQSLLLVGRAEPPSKAFSMSVWSRASGVLVLRAPMDDDVWHRAALSPDGRTLAISSPKGSVGLWEVATGKEVLRVAGHTKAVTALTFSPDGAILATGGYDRVTRLWDVADGHERATFEGHSEHVSALAFSPDGKTLATVSSDTTGLVWDLASLRPEPSTAQELDRDACFADLRETAEVSKAYRAMAMLSRAGDSVVPYLLDRLLRPSVDPKRTRDLLEALDHADIDKRAKAVEELERMGNERLLRSALLETLSAEARARLETVLKGFEGPCPRAGETLLAIRAVQVLERIDSSAARSALEEIVKDQPQCRLALEAKAALSRKK